MASLADTADFLSVAEEKFDFDISLSPASSKGDEEDEVFLGPVRHKERCISYGVETRVKDSVSSGYSLGDEPSWSPLTGDKFEEMCKEAHLLASHIEQTTQGPAEVEATAAAEKQPEGGETFEETFDSSAKLSMMGKPADVLLSPIKRETFCVQDSPLKQLPPAIQQRLLRASEVAGPGKPRLRASSPLKQAKVQPMMALRGRAALASSTGVLPSRPMAPGSVQPSAKTRPAPALRTRLLPPSKGTLGPRRSSSSGNPNRAGSVEDHLSDTGSVASDVSDSSLNSSLPGKRGLPAPSKTGLRGPPAVKAKAPLLAKRGNTSSSSSSVSSINSSLSVSPTGMAKLSSSLNSSVAGVSAHLPTSIGRLPNSGATKSRKSSLISRPPDPPARGRPSLSAQGRKGSEPLSRPVKCTPIKRLDPAPTPKLQTPARRTMARTASVPNIPAASTKPDCVVKGNPKLKAFVAPTPTNHLKGPRRSEVVSSPDVPRIMKPKRLMSACSMESLVQKPAVPLPLGFHTPSAAGNKSLSVQSKMRLSALPTPISRRVSGIPMLTPKSVSRPDRPSHTTENLPASARKASHASPAQLKEIQPQGAVELHPVPSEEPRQPAELQPCSLVFSLEDEAEGPAVAAPKPSAHESSSDPRTEGQEPPRLDAAPQTLPNTEETPVQPDTTKTQEITEVLLVDAPAPALRTEEKLLIDLSNTPDLIRTSSVKPCGGQLIDLSSPLIRWSPEDKKENALNDAPLINLSF